MPEPRTDLPRGMPRNLTDFARCRSDQEEVSPGELDWLPKPGNADFIPDVPPELTFEQGEGGAVSLSVGWGMIRITVDVSVVDGNLEITTDNPLIPRRQLEKFQDDLNADLRDHGKQFDKVEVVDGKLRMSKRPIAVEVEEPVVVVPAPAPVVTPPPEDPILTPDAPSGAREFVNSWKGKATITTGAIAIGVVAWLLFTDEGEPIEVPPAPTTHQAAPTTGEAAPTTGPAPTTEQPPTTGQPPSTGSTEPVSFDDPTLDEVVQGVGRPVGPGSPTVMEISDPRGDGIDSIAGRSPAYMAPAVDIVMTYTAPFPLDADQAAESFNDSIFECGAQDPVVVCSPGALDVPEGDVLMVAVQMAGEIPPASPDKDFIYSLVFDSDGDPTNDWVFNPPFDWDYFQGTDRWYQAVWSTSTGQWSLTATQVSEGNQIAGVPTAVRAVIAGDWIVWFVPSSELPAFPGALRATAFGHDGTFSETSRGGDVTGADPTEALITP